MNTIAAQMPKMDANVKSVQKETTNQEDKASTFEELMAETKEQTGKDTIAETEDSKRDSKQSETLLSGQPVMTALFYADAVQMLTEPAKTPEIQGTDTGETAPLNMVDELPAAQEQKQESVIIQDTQIRDGQMQQTKSEQTVQSRETADMPTAIQTDIPADKSTAMQTEKPVEHFIEKLAEQLVEKPMQGLEQAVTQTGKKDTKESETAVKPELHMKEDTPVNTKNYEVQAEKPVQHKADDIRPEYMEQLKANIAKQIASGKDQFEIQLTPANLGTLVIKASYEAGKAMISIVCNEAKTMQAMSQQARELAQMVEDRTGSQTEVIVDKPSQDYLQQQGNQEKGKGEQHSDRKQQENKKAGFQDNIDFLQQLRLGLA